MFKKHKIENFLNLIFGIASLLGFIIAVVVLFFSYDQSESEKYIKTIIVILGITTATFTLGFISMSFYYINRLSFLNEAENEVEILKDKIRNSEIIIKNTSEYINNITYYQRQILSKFDDLLEKGVINEDNIKKLTEDFTQFLSTFTANLQSYFTLVTSDNCAITVKIVKNKKVKTFYRDSISYRSRRQTDKNTDGSDFIYNISDNYAFDVITSPDFKECSYFCNNLRENPDYKNLNDRWKNFYNATAVVPISLNIGDYKDNILGFLCVDNFNGNLSLKAVEGFLYSSSSIIYNVLVKFEKIATFANHNNIMNDSIQKFSNWSNR